MIYDSVMLERRREMGLARRDAETTMIRHSADRDLHIRPTISHKPERTAARIEGPTYVYDLDEDDEARAALLFARGDLHGNVGSRSVSAPLPLPADPLERAGITSSLPAEQLYSEIWCVFRDRDESLLIGEHRLATCMEMVLSLNGAFHALVRMAGFSEDRVEQLGISASDGNLEGLCTLLSELTGDRFSFSPYETSIEERLLNFLR